MLESQFQSNGLAAGSGRARTCATVRAPSSVRAAEGDLADRGFFEGRDVVLPDIEIEQVVARSEPVARAAVGLGAYQHRASSSHRVPPT